VCDNSHKSYNRSLMSTDEFYQRGPLLTRVWTRTQNPSVKYSSFQPATNFCPIRDATSPILQSQDMADLNYLSQAFRNVAIGSTTSLQKPLSSAEYSVGLDFLVQGPGWVTDREFIIRQLSEPLYWFLCTCLIFLSRY
jgi:hypothetical protein